MAEANDAAFIPACAMPSDAPLRRPALGVVLLASSFFPARAARHVLHVPLWKCWVVHFLVGLFGLFFVPVTVSLLFGGLSEFLREVDNLADHWRQYPLSSSVAMLGIVLAVESIFLVLVAVATAWGSMAGDRLRDSFRHALRQVWLRTPHAVLVVFLVAFLVVGLQSANRQWRGGPPVFTQWPTPPNPPTLTPTDPGYLAAQKQFELDWDAFQTELANAKRTYRDWWATRPWHLRYEGPICVTTAVGGIVWWLGAMLAGVGVRRTVAAGVRSPLCLWCGYDLSMMPLESRCPECGKGVGDSLSEHAQPGAPWERARADGRVIAWFHTWRAWSADVQELGRRLTLIAQVHDHRTYMLLHLPIIFFVGAAGVAAAFFQDNDQGDEWLYVGSLFGLVCVIGATVACCATASLVGWYASLRAKRNLLPAAMQIAAYGATYLTAWALFGALLINSAIYLERHDLYRSAQDFTGMHRDFLFFLSCFVPNLLCGLLYVWMVARGTSAARNANR